MSNTPSPVLIDEILQYLSKHPEAGDSVDGIATWWLKRQRYEDSVERVQEVMDWLVARGVVVRVELADGSILYRPASTLGTAGSDRLQ